jgi:hypothetical protein
VNSLVSIDERKGLARATTYQTDSTVSLKGLETTILAPTNEVADIINDHISYPDEKK